MTEPIEHLHAVVLAGGSGVRFWPLSREMTPKQMLSIFGGESLVTKAVRRIAPLTGPGRVAVVTGEGLVTDLRGHLASQPDTDALGIRYLVEPEARNTAAAAALAAAWLYRQDPEATMIMLPSDHLLDDSPLWQEVVRVAADLAAEGWLVTVGLRPTTPETGYGYIHAGAPLPAHEGSTVTPAAVAAFIEKPSRATAVEYLADGSYLWNSGMLVAKASRLLEELDAAGGAARTPDSAHGAEIADAARAVAALPLAEWGSDGARALFGGLPSVPLDTALLEVSDRVAVVPADMDWSDVGSLLAVERLGESDERGNTLVGEAVAVDSDECTVYAPERFVATLGMRDAVVIDTLDATLVCSRDRVQDVRLVVDALKAAGRAEAVAPRTMFRPWGEWSLLLKADGFQVKSITVLPGHRLSLQSHTRRSEHWVVVSGTATVQLGERELAVPTNESVYVCAGVAHRLTNTGEEPLRIIEVAVGLYLEEDDIVRYDDDWGREESPRGEVQEA